MSNYIFLIFYLLITIISQFFIIYSIKKFSNKKVKLKLPIILIMIIASIIECFLSQKLQPIINCIICITYFLILSKFTLQMKLKDAIFYNFIVWFFIIIIDMSAMLIFNLSQIIFPILKENIELVKSLCTIIYGILLFLPDIRIIKKIVEKSYKFYQKITYSNLFIIVIFVLYFLLDAISIKNLQNNAVIEIVISSSIILALTIIKFILNKYEIETLKKTNNLLIKNNEFYIKLLNDYRILKHNLTSQLLGIKNVADEKSQKLIADIIKKYNKSFQFSQDLKDTPSGVNGLIYEKVYNFNKKQIQIAVDNKITSDILTVLTPHSYNLLCETLGVVLDNALEATYKSKEKIVYLKFTETTENIEITVINTFNGTIDIDKLGTINYSTKGKQHGVGLFSILNRKKINIKTTLKNNLFIIEIKIKKIKS